MKPICAFIILACLTGCFGKTPEKTGKEGAALPAFNILLTDSITVLNTSNISAGKPVALFYFSPYCPYCRAQTQEIVEEMDDLKDIQFYFVTSYPLSTLRGFKEQYKLGKFPNITIGVDKDRFIGKYFELTGIPYVAIYSKNKKLNNAFQGKITAAQLKEVAEE